MRKTVREPFWIAFTASSCPALAGYAAYNSLAGIFIWSAVAIVLSTVAEDAQ